MILILFIFGVIIMVESLILVVIISKIDDMLTDIKILKTRVQGLLSREDNNTRNSDDIRQRLEEDYLNHMKDLNNFNKRLIKIERRLDHEN